MRRLMFAFLAIALALVPMTSASAASVHLKGGKNAAPAFTDDGVTLSAAGALSGLGNGDVLVTMEADADVVSTCTNQGGNAAPGQNPAPLTVAGSQAIPQDELKNGTTPFSVVTEAPELVIPGAPDCPNSNWTETIDDLAFTAAVITVEQAGALVLTVTCTFAPATTDGDVARQGVSCIQS